jgi:cation diffusion facilitator family transporter
MSDGTLAALPPARMHLLRRGLRLEYLTVGWNLVEGVIAVAAAVAAGSVALLGFGVDSFVESASGSVLIWRLRAERRAADEEAVERLERRASRLVGGTFFLLAAYVTIDAVMALVGGERPDPSAIGIGLTATSIAVMWWLARVKLRTAVALGSKALEADALQTAACWWLSLVVLGGVGLNTLFGWWWADPFAAIGISVLLAREGLEAWRDEEHA